jgi:hypothetical protein
MTGNKTITTTTPIGRELRLANGAIELIHALDDYEGISSAVTRQKIEEVRETLNQQYGRKL